MTERTSRIYVPPLRVDVTVRGGVPNVVPLRRLARALRAAALRAGAPLPAAVGLVLTDDAELAALNRRHLGQPGPTDVLSFPLLAPDAFGRRAAGQAAAGRPGPAFRLPPRIPISLGDIAVSVERAIAQAAQGRGGQDRRTRWEARDEMLLLVVHGMLHLCGRDHAAPADREAMRALEQRVLRELQASGL